MPEPASPAASSLKEKWAGNDPEIRGVNSLGPGLEVRGRFINDKAASRNGPYRQPATPRWPLLQTLSDQRPPVYPAGFRQFYGPTINGQKLGVTFLTLVVLGLGEAAHPGFALQAVQFSFFALGAGII